MKLFHFRHGESRIYLLPLFLGALCLFSFGANVLVSAKDTATEPPAKGETAPDFELENLSGQEVELSQKLKQGPVVLLVLRGYPGYQCPICTRQVGQFINAADEFKKENTTVLMVYPGPADNLSKRGKEFMEGTTLPEHFQLLLDPGYLFTNAYGLRWDAPRETAYPSAFVIGKDGKVQYSKISKTHGGRASAKEVLDVLK